MHDFQIPKYLTAIGFSIVARLNGFIAMQPTYITFKLQFDNWQQTFIGIEIIIIMYNFINKIINIGKLYPSLIKYIIIMHYLYL